MPGPVVGAGHSSGGAGQASFSGCEGSIWGHGGKQWAQDRFGCLVVAPDSDKMEGKEAAQSGPASGWKLVPSG